MIILKVEGFKEINTYLYTERYILIENPRQLSRALTLLLHVY